MRAHISLVTQSRENLAILPENEMKNNWACIFKVDAKIRVQYENKNVNNQQFGINLHFCPEITSVLLETDNKNKRSRCIYTQKELLENTGNETINDDDQTK